jgi:N,N-dimethylformamidase beta subunit-like protein/uncharacterized protein DUF4082/Big-like domain-containing protein
MLKMSTHPYRSRRALRRVAALAALALLPVGLTVVTTTDATAAIDPCGPSGNKISCENSKPGTPQSEWDDYWGAGDADIQGFATDISVNVGQRIDFKIDTNARAYDITIYRLGYYGGDGAREITSISPSVSLPQTQPSCITEAATELYDCGNWAVSAFWNVPSTMVSGVYIARLHRPDSGGSSHITFIVRDDSSHSDLVFQTSDTTWQAYNDYGGSSFYHGGANGRTYKASYNRPFATRGGATNHDFFFANEYPMVRFLEKNGYDVSYIAGVDTDRRGALLKNHKTYLSVGHDEYWSGAQRANVEAARDAGVNLMFLSGNEMYWRTRYEPSADSSHTPYRTLVSYKETWDNAKVDPSSEWTGTWRDPRFAPRTQGGGRPENALTGTMYMSNFTDLAVTVSAAEGKLRLWRNTSLASMSSGSAALAPHTIGYESNEDVDNGERPPGLIRLSTTNGPTPQYVTDFGNTVTAGTTTHHLTMYRAASGALVFSAGTIQWTWGLDGTHDSDLPLEPADLRMQQAQVNLLADMSAQPTTLSSNLTPATKSTDTAGPTVTVATPASGASIANGAETTVSGTATDTGGGRVAGVEVSTDAGATWHPATGTTSWSYSYVQSGTGAATLRVRAVDDSANIGATVTRNIAVTCPCSVFGATVPAVPAVDDTGGAELGLRFSPTTDGFITGIRFYKGTGNGGTHVGSLWRTTGERLAQATFSSESASGWQTVRFPTAVPVSAGQTYVASYTAPQGRYSMEKYAFSSQGVNAGPLQVAGGFGATPAGVYSYPGQYPDASFRNSNYFVDVTFSAVDDSPLIATNPWPLPDSTSVPPTTTISAKLNKPVVAGSVGVTVKDANNVTVPGSTSYDATTRTVTFAPAAALNGFVQHTVTLAATDAQGNAITAGKTWSFTTAKPASPPGVCPCTLFDEAKVPSVLEANDPGPVTLGVRFTADRAGSVTGIRFYKSAGNTGTHTGALWTASGTLLAQGTFANESSAGWQTLTFDTPVAIAKNTQYVASYRAPVGRWSADLNAFTGADLNRAPLHVLANSGAYTYGTGFPGSSSPSNYHVDVLFEKGAPTIGVAGQDPAPGALSVPRSAPINVTFTEPIQPSGYAMQVSQVTGSGTTAIAGTVTRSADSMGLTFTPSAPMPADSDVRVVLSGVTSAEGAALPTQTWTFHTRSPDDASAQTLFSDVVPQNPAANESAPVELGTVFQPTKSGKVTAIRFFKGSGNAGTHTGSIWSMAGQRLATVTFTNETATGWQSATLSTPVQVTAGTSYVVSYYAPQGHYSYTSGFFSDAWTSGALAAPAGANGRYLYAAGGGFPTDTWGSANYFVDVLFTPDPSVVSITSRTPAIGATDVPRSVKPSVSFSAPIVSGWSMSVTAGTTTIAGSAALSADGRTLTFTPSAPLPASSTITVTLTGVVSTDDAALGTQSWTFGTEAGATAVVSLLTGQTPANANVSDGLPLELGMAFTPSSTGAVTGIRFFKGASNTGVHTGSIWSSTGTRLATVTFTNETASGWQTADLATPLTLTAGQTYVVSYYSPTGTFAITGGYFGAPVTAGPLTAPTANGRYVYGSGGGFPSGTSGGRANYWVDVVYRYQTG